MDLGTAQAQRRARINAEDVYVDLTDNDRSDMPEYLVAGLNGSALPEYWAPSPAGLGTPLANPLGSVQSQVSGIVLRDVMGHTMPWPNGSRAENCVLRI